MDRLAHTVQNYRRRQQRVRAKIHGTAERPRLSVFISHKHASAQLIDDDSHKTLLAVSSVGQKAATGNMSDKAAWVGQQVAKKAKAAKINSAVFDRGGRLYHGRVKALADAAREAGLEF